MKYFVMAIKRAQDGFEIVSLLTVVDDFINGCEYLLDYNTDKDLIYVIVGEYGSTVRYISDMEVEDNFDQYGNILLRICNPTILLRYYKEALKDFSHIECKDYLCKILKLKENKIVFEGELDSHYYEFIKRHNLLIERR